MFFGFVFCFFVCVILIDEFKKLLYFGLASLVWLIINLITTNPFTQMRVTLMYGLATFLLQALTITMVSAIDPLKRSKLERKLSNVQVSNRVKSLSQTLMRQVSHAGSNMRPKLASPGSGSDISIDHEDPADFPSSTDEHDGKSPSNLKPTLTNTTSLSTSKSDQRLGLKKHVSMPSQSPSIGTQHSNHSEVSRHYRQASVGSKSGGSGFGTMQSAIFDILGDKDGFESFATHCVRELSIENLLFILEYMQLKHQIKSHLLS